MFLPLKGGKRLHSSSRTCPTSQKVSRTLLSKAWNVLEGRRVIRDLPQSAQGCPPSPEEHLNLSKDSHRLLKNPHAAPTTTTPFKQPLCRSEGSNVLDDPLTTASSRTSPTSSLTFYRILNNRKFPGTPIASLKALADLYSLSHSPYSPLKEPQNLSKGSFQSVYGFLPDPREAPNASPRTRKTFFRDRNLRGRLRNWSSKLPLSPQGAPSLLLRWRSTYFYICAL